MKREGIAIIGEDKAKEREIDTARRVYECEERIKELKHDVIGLIITTFGSYIMFIVTIAILATK